MQHRFWKQLVTLSALALATLFSPGAHALCAPSAKSAKPISWRSYPGTLPLLRSYVEEREPDSKWTPSIVGMWVVTFTAKTMDGNGIPDTVIDKALVVWHADNTEIMNSGRPPQDGNFCLGVWQRTDALSYRLNHFAWAANSYAPTDHVGTIGQPIGGVHYKENVLLGPEGKHYTGTFTLDEYDTTGKLVLVSFAGTIKATRITVDTPFSDLL